MTALSLKISQCCISKWFIFIWRHV